MSRITQAFVLGAGLGLRLRPLTEQRPKPLVPIFQKPLLTFALDHLRSVGIEPFVINTHRLAAQSETALPERATGSSPAPLRPGAPAFPRASRGASSSVAARVSLMSAAFAAA